MKQVRLIHYPLYRHGAVHECEKCHWQFIIQDRENDGLEWDILEQADFCPRCGNGCKTDYTGVRVKKRGEMICKMICKQCQERGLKSRVYAGATGTTTMYCTSFYDEEGNYHRHDTNTSTTSYTCSNGHAWTETETPTCQCGWPDFRKK